MNANIYSLIQTVESFRKRMREAQEDHAIGEKRDPLAAIDFSILKRTGFRASPPIVQFRPVFFEYNPDHLY